MQARACRARARRMWTAKEPVGLEAQNAIHPNMSLAAYVLYCIPRAEVPNLLTLAIEEEINATVQATWSDFTLADDLCIDNAHAHLFDMLFYLRDENGELVGFRSVIWQADVKAWVFENGVVRDQGNGLGSILVQMVVRHLLESPEIDDARRRVAANVETTNTANIRLYENFRCRTKGDHFQKKFQRGRATKKITKDRSKWISFVFP